MARYLFMRDVVFAMALLCIVLMISKLTENFWYFVILQGELLCYKFKKTYLLKSPCSDPPSWVSFSRQRALLDVSSLAALSKSAGTFHRAAWSSALESLAKKTKNTENIRWKVLCISNSEFEKYPPCFFLVRLTVLLHQLDHIGWNQTVKS